MSAKNKLSVPQHRAGTNHWIIQQPDARSVEPASGQAESPDADLQVTLNSRMLLDLGWQWRDVDARPVRDPQR
jgi:hypothetical protein